MLNLAKHGLRRTMMMMWLAQGLSERGAMRMSHGLGTLPRPCLPLLFANYKRFPNSTLAKSLREPKGHQVKHSAIARSVQTCLCSHCRQLGKIRHGL